jgi:hypothetical protein
MSRLRRCLGPLLGGALLVAGAGLAVGQQTPVVPEAALRAEMAAMTLERSNLPGDYLFQGETFLSSAQVAGETLEPADLENAGYVAGYASVYRNHDTGQVITSYVSAWDDASAAEDGFSLLEDEALTHPNGSLVDDEAPVGESPGETTTGTYPDPSTSGQDVGIVDTTFRVDRFLVGVSHTTPDGSDADVALVESLAGTMESRATAVVGGSSPEGADLSLPSQVASLAANGTLLQAGFLDTGDAEQMYGLQGSALGQFTASWIEVVSLGAAPSMGPYLGIGLTVFDSAEDAGTVVEQLQELMPALPDVEPVEVSIDGADAALGYRFTSVANDVEGGSSFRLVAQIGETLIVVDAQGMPEPGQAQESAIQIADAQARCVGATSCQAPELPADLAG